MRLTTRKAWPAIYKRQPFTTGGALSGQTVENGSRIRTLGELPDKWRELADSRTVDYVVYSYVTPIAWHDTVHGWVVPSERYSVTTSRHQSQVARAIVPAVA